MIIKKRKPNKLMFVGIALILMGVVLINPIKNSVSEKPDSITLSVPNASLLDDVSIDQNQIVLSYFADNQTEYIQNQLQNQILSNTIVNSEKKSLTFNPIIEKVDEKNVIRERILVEPFNLLSYITPKNSNQNIEAWKIRVTLNGMTEKAQEQVVLTGNVRVLVNNQTFSDSTFLINSKSNPDREVFGKFSLGDYLEIPYSSLVGKLNDNQINTLKIILVDIKGNMDDVEFAKSNIVLYSSEIDYSKFKVVVKNDSLVSEKIYPKDSKLVFSTSEGYGTQARCLGYTRYYHECVLGWTTEPDGRIFPAPALTSLKIVDSSGKIIVEMPSVGSKAEFLLQRNNEFHVTVSSPKMDFTLKTPDDVAVTYNLTCIGTANGPSCVHP